MPLLPCVIEGIQAASEGALFKTIILFYNKGFIRRFISANVLILRILLNMAITRNEKIVPEPRGTRNVN